MALSILDPPASSSLTNFRIEPATALAPSLRLWAGWWVVPLVCAVRLAAGVAPRLYGGAIRTNPELLRDQGIARFRHPPSRLGYAWQLGAAAGFTSLPWLHRLRQPTLILAGDDDPIVNLANARIMAGLIPRSQLKVIPGGGHLFLITRPETHATVVESFLSA